MKFLQNSLNAAKNVLTKVLFLSMLMLFVFITVFPFVSFAQSNNPPAVIESDSSQVTITNPINASSINGFIKDVLEGVIKIGIPLIAIAIIYSGFLFVTAQGKPGDIETAKRAFMYTIIGAAILLGAWAIAQLISNTVLSL